jgi:5'-3' exonuclease
MINGVWCLPYIMLEAAPPILVVADAMGIVRRCHEAIRDDDDDARAEAALQSADASIRRGLRDHGPTHFLAAFDHGGPTWRSELYDRYKISRPPMPEALKAQLPWFVRKLNKDGMCTISVPGVEADDTIATITAKALARGFRVVILSSDKDICHLVSIGAELRDHFNREWRHEAWIKARFGVPSRLIPDLLALAGDDRDDIPGVPGVGERIAPRLLLEHGDLEGVLAAAAASELKGKLSQKVHAAAELARLCKQLATLRFDVDLGALRPRDLELPESLRYDPKVAGPRAIEQLHESAATAGTASRTHTSHGVAPPAVEQQQRAARHTRP